MGATEKKSFFQKWKHFFFHTHYNFCFWVLMKKSCCLKLNPQFILTLSSSMTFLIWKIVANFNVPKLFLFIYFYLIFLKPEMAQTFKGVILFSMNSSFRNKYGLVLRRVRFLRCFSIYFKNNFSVKKRKIFFQNLNISKQVDKNWEYHNCFL